VRPGSRALALSKVTWGEEGLLRHTVFVGLREDKPVREVRRETPARLP
jgi:ATP-dependent DNA ligase